MNMNQQSESTNNTTCRSEPAFPNIYGRNIEESTGLTKREYFAGLAMQGIWSTNSKDDITIEHIAEVAVKQADALIAALNGGGDKQLTPAETTSNSPSNACEPSGGEEI